MVPNCFRDPDVVELVRKQFRSPAPALTVEDKYGSRLCLVREDARTYTYFVSPFDAGIEVGARAPGEVRADDLLSDLTDRLLEAVKPHRDLLVKIRIPGWFFESRPHALLEPFLLHGFTVEMDLWERVVDLRTGDTEILARCETMTRRKIRQGLKSTAKWRVYHGEPVSEALMAALYEAAVKTRSASGGRLKHAPEAYLRDRRLLIERGKASLGVLEHGDFTGYLLALVSEEMGFYFDGAWTGAPSDFANHLLQYRTMLHLRELGCRRYVVGTVLPDMLSRSEKVANMARFKHGLGADLVPVYLLTLRRESRVGRVIARVRRSPVGPVVGRLRRLAEGP
jgi:hypothetical protein